MRKIILLMLVLALTACSGGGSQGEAEEVATANPTTTETLATTTEGQSSQGHTPLLGTRLVTGVVYHPTDDRFSADSGLTDVIAPTDGGPWPTVVVFHGDPRGVSKESHRSDATEIAEHGRVVFLPAWGDTTHSLSDPAAIDGTWDMLVQEITCAVVFAQAHTEEYGGDPDHITLYGLSAGGNAVLMAGLAGAEPLDTCRASGPTISPEALVPIDADWVLGGGWDSQLSENPEAFYSFTPWRYLDGSQDVRIDVMVTEDQSLVRSVDPDPATSWLSYRHPDIDLPAELEAMGFLDDGDFSLIESGEYAHAMLIDAGYDATLVAMPGARHAYWGAEGRQVVVETVLRASADGPDGGVERFSASPRCLADMEAAASVPGVHEDLSEHNQVLHPTFISCTSVDEWEAAANAAGLADLISMGFIEGECGWNPGVSGSPLCVAAAESGN